MRADGAIVEVALNEAVTPALHARVPQSPAECAADARRCAEAGAAIAHWHGVDAAGVQRLGDVALHAEALAAIDGCLLAYPSYPVDVPPTVDDRLGHCLALRRDGMELGPVDVSTVNLVLPDVAAPLPLEHAVISNPAPFVVDALRAYGEAGLVPTVASFDVGGTRTIAALCRAGVLAPPALVKIFLWGMPLIGPEPSVDALDLHLRQLPDDLDVEWLVVPYGVADRGLIEELARAALERGGGVRVGIGDNPFAFADLDNAGAVELAVKWAADAGRPVATPADVRERFGTTPRR